MLLIFMIEYSHNFKVRLQWHKSTVTHGLEKNAVFQQVKTKNHAIHNNKSFIVYHSDLEPNRLVVESTLMKENPTFINTLRVKSIASLQLFFFIVSPNS